MAILILSVALLSTSFASSLRDGKFEAVTAGSNTAQCLPQDVAATDIVSAEPIGSGSSPKIRRVTVSAKLKQLRARCRRGKLVDAKGTEIRFYHLQGCWGNPPENYEEILAEQAKELENLRKRYRVIEMTCNPTGELISLAGSRRGF